MPCAHPIPATQREAGARVRLSRVRDVRDYDLVSVGLADSVLLASQLLLPCGTCVGCQLSRARSWAVRCSLELLQHRAACFVTLTFSEKYVPPALRRSDVSEFMWRLRKKLPPRSVRFFACGEYGEWFGRPHYHALLFGTEDEEVIRRAWAPRGFVTVDCVTDARVSYTAGYCAKKVGMLDKSGELRVDYATGEEYRSQAPFLQMSRRPGIGGAARRSWRSWRSFAVWSGARVPVPRFLHSSWKEKASDSELAELEREKLEARMRPTVRELDASEAIVRTRMAHNADRRSL